MWMHVTLTLQLTKGNTWSNKIVFVMSKQRTLQIKQGRNTQLPVYQVHPAIANSV